LSRYLREAETQEIVITRHGKPAGVLVGFESDEDWFEYRFEHDPRFLRRIEQARNSVRAGRGKRLAKLASSVSDWTKKRNAIPRARHEIESHPVISFVFGIIFHFVCVCS
jgi:prevent-host-death family protein